MGFAKLSHQRYQFILFLFNCQVIRLLETQRTVALGHGVSPFGGIQHTPVDSCLAASCNPGVLTRDECMSFYSAIIPSRFNSKCTSSRQLLQKASPPTHTLNTHCIVRWLHKTYSWNQCFLLLPSLQPGLGHAGGVPKFGELTKSKTQHGHHQMVNSKIMLIVGFAVKWRSSIQIAKTRPGADCVSDHELLIAKFRLKLKKVGGNTRPFSSVQLLSHVRLFATPWTTACQASLSTTNSWSLLKLMPIELVMPSNHLILCHPLLLPPSIFSSIRVFSSKSFLHLRWPKHWSFSFSISPSNEYSGLISFRINWFDLLAV